jgi:four helix bundle protein
MHDFRRLDVWHKAHALSFRADALAAKIRRRKPHLASQMERAADSIAALVAEGSGADSDKEFARFVTMGIKSANEYENHIEKCRGARLANDAECDSHIDDTSEVRRMLIGLRKRLRGH